MLSNTRVHKAVKVSNVVAMAAGYLFLVALLIGFLIKQQSVGLELSRTEFLDPVHAAVTSSGYQWDERLTDDGLYADAEGLHLWLSGPSHDLETAALELYACPGNDRAGLRGFAAGSFISVAFPDLNVEEWLQKLSRRDQTHVANGRVPTGSYNHGKIILFIASED